MNAILCRTTDVELASCELSSLEESYATAPLAAVVPLPQLLSDEELHTQFEKAIGNRLLAVSQRLSLLSTSTAHVSAASKSKQSSALVQAEDSISALSSSFLREKLRPIVLLSCFAVMFLLLGFDLMGFLVLHAR